MRLPVWLGSDDGITVWLNGKLLLARDVHRPCAPDQEQLELDLEAGENRLLVKITNGVLQSGFYFALGERGDAWNGDAGSSFRTRILEDFPEHREDVILAFDEGLLGTEAITRRYDHDRLRPDGGWRPDAIGEDGNTWGWRSQRAGASMEFEFIGTEVSLLHRTRSDYPLLLGSGRSCGQVAVAMDGGPPLTFDTSRNDGRTLLARGLLPGAHQLTLTNLGRGADPGENDGTVIIAGFAVDTVSDNEVTRLAGRIAERVGGGETWHRQAGSLASTTTDPEDLPAVWKHHRAARQTEALSRRLGDVRAEPPVSRFISKELEDWVPDEDARAYRERLAGLVERLAPLVGRARAFSFKEGDPESLDELLAALRHGCGEVDAFFAAEGRRLPPIVFFTGSPLQSGAAPNHVWQSEPRGPWGCSIRRWDPGRPAAPAEILFEDPKAILFDLTVSADARTLLFSMRREGERYWQIHEMEADGSGRRQLTRGDHHNVGPVPLPDGRVAFLSSRTRGYHTVCQSGPSMHVHVMKRDGSGARDLSNNTLTDFGLSALRDGRLLFTRWEYIDVNLTYRQSLWTQQPDGRRYQLHFGNTIIDPAVIWQAREIPGRGTLVCTFTSHHHTPHGAIGLVNPRAGREAPRDVGYRWISREFPSVVDLDLYWAYRDPYPVAQNRFLVSYGGGGLERFRICLLDEMDNRTTIYEDPATSCFYPQPMLPRPEPARLPEEQPDGRVAGVRVPASPPGQPRAETVALGNLLVADVYQGLGPEVERGRAKLIRIMEQLPKTVNRTWYTMNDQGPLMGAGTYYAKRVWGYAPIEEDGSAHFEAPAMKEIYLQVCDEEGRELQRMTSAIQLMPGETQGCVGCHENRGTAAPTAPRLAAVRPSTPLRLPPWGHAGVLDYPRVVQPVLDRHCVRCHRGGDPDGGVLLTGNFTRYFNMSYDQLVMDTGSDARSKAFYQGRGGEKPMVQIAHLLVGTGRAYRPLTSGSLVSRLPEVLHSRALRSGAARRGPADHPRVDRRDGAILRHPGVCPARGLWKPRQVGRTRESETAAVVQRPICPGLHAALRLVSRRDQRAGAAGAAAMGVDRPQRTAVEPGAHRALGQDRRGTRHCGRGFCLPGHGRPRLPAVAEGHHGGSGGGPTGARGGYARVRAGPGDGVSVKFPVNR